jgi:hypothetical protein
MRNGLAVRYYIGRQGPPAATAAATAADAAAAGPAAGRGTRVRDPLLLTRIISTPEIRNYSAFLHIMMNSVLLRRTPDRSVSK